MEFSISAMVSFRGMMFPPFLGIETAANAGPRRCRCKEKGEAAKLRSLHILPMGRLFSCARCWTGQKEERKSALPLLSVMFQLLQIQNITSAKYDASTLWVRSGHALGTISRIQDNTGCRCSASVHLVWCWYHLGVRLVFSRCDELRQSQKNHDPQDSESRGSHFYVYSISWVNTDMQLTSYWHDTDMSLTRHWHPTDIWDRLFVKQIPFTNTW